MLDHPVPYPSAQCLRLRKVFEHAPAQLKQNVNRLIISFTVEPFIIETLDRVPPRVGQVFARMSQRQQRTSVVRLADPMNRQICIIRRVVARRESGNARGVPVYEFGSKDLGKGYCGHGPESSVLIPIGEPRRGIIRNIPMKSSHHTNHRDYRNSLRSTSQ
jgi:hypothetical protein